VSIAWDGGRHHARKASASGYCYVNDAVLAIFRLLDAFERVMYIDVCPHASVTRRQLCPLTFCLINCIGNGSSPD
jgi:hypothetical protein